MKMIEQSDHVFENSEFAFWLSKARRQPLALREKYDGYRVQNKAAVHKAAMLWEQLGCPYEQAITLFEGNEADKRKAISMVHELGAVEVYEKMKQEMRTAGIKSIPRGIRKTTQSNAAFLTNRELDVLQLLKEGMQNKEIATRLFISAKTVDHHISAILFKLDVNSRVKAVHEALRLEIIK
jgi:DNA-binding CsgD family transcriptional regulator